MDGPWQQDIGSVLLVAAKRTRVGLGVAGQEIRGPGEFEEWE